MYWIKKDKYKNCHYSQRSTQKTQMTEDEIINNTETQWHTLEDMITLISSPVHDTNQRKFLQARDVAAIKEYLSIII